MRDDRFEWDNRKATSKLKRHHVSFDEATDVFDVPDFVDDDDPDPDEIRTCRIGRSGSLLPVVGYTEREDRDGNNRTRIISARESASHEEARHLSP